MDIDSTPSRKQIIELAPKISDVKQCNIDCKICLSNYEDEENIMVKLCNCTGSIEIAHINCIKQWMATKLSKKANEKNTVLSYNIKSFNCEICKKPYPLKFELNGKNYSLIDITIPDKNYLVLESLNQTKDNCNYKSIHVIKITEGERILLGRGHDCDIRINDISVSRKHSVLEFSEGSVLLKDLYSKFGTLSLIHDDIVMSEKNMYLQIGRTFVRVCLEKTNKSISNISNVKLTKSANTTESIKQLNKGLLDFSEIDKNIDIKLDLNNGNLSKPKVLFKVEKVENKNFKNLSESDNINNENKK